MTDHDQLREPGTPEWTVALALRTGLRRHLGPRHGYVLAILAGEIVAALRLARWRISKEPPDPPHSTPGE